MISSALFARYARALVDVAMEDGQEQQVNDGLSVYREIFQKVPDLLIVFDSPAVPRDAKERVLKELMARQPDDGELPESSVGPQSNSVLPRDLRLLRQNGKRAQGHRRGPSHRRIAPFRAGSGQPARYPGRSYQPDRCPGSGH